MKKIIPVVIALMLVACCMFSACSDIADNTEHFDTITKKLKLTKAYAGKSLLQDGIGEVDVDIVTDGDTLDFTTVQGISDTLRFYGVDTPESTGGVEPWGKAASKFVKETLQAADKVVIEGIYTSTGSLDRDTAGNRLLGYVWYKTGAAEFKLLNLELVENGYSENKCSRDASYYNYFAQAVSFASKIQLRLHSKLDDPMYSDKATPITLKELVGHEQEYDGETVVFEAFVTELYATDSGSKTFTVTQIDETTGAEYSISLYAGYNKTNGGLKLGALYKIVGTIGQYKSGPWQISGFEFDDYYEGDQKTKTINRNYYLTFDGDEGDKISGWNAAYNQNYYGYVTVTDIDYDEANNKLTFKGTAKQYTKDGPTEAAKEFTFVVSVPQGYSVRFNVGDKLRIEGFQKTTGVITILDEYDYIDIVY